MFFEISEYNGMQENINNNRQIKIWSFYRSEYW